VSAPTDTRQISLLPPDAATLLHLVRENLRLLAALAGRYEVSGHSPTLDRLTVRRPADVAAYLSAEMAPLAQEQLRAVLLDSRNHVMRSVLVYQGGLNATVIRLGDCFRDAVAGGAAAVVLVHNHPSGDPTPSPEDVRLTADAARAGELLGVELLDHVVIGQPGHVSLRELGLYCPNSPPDA
jgi:DNA repair protein RadC